MALLLSLRSVVPAATSGLLPRWDLAAHLLNGWTTYDHLVHGRLASFAWDVWNQGYWPPGQSLFQVPFYLAAGGRLAGGLLSSTAAFGLTALGAVQLLGAISGRRAWLPGALVVALMCTSPFFLAHATVAMSEMVGAMAEMAVLVCIARDHRSQNTATARWLAISLSWLFFVKYNFFLLVAVPLAVHVLLEHLAATPASERWRPALRAAAWGSTVPGAITIAYVVGVAAILLAGGFSVEIAGQRAAFRTVGYSLHPPLYGWLAYAWYSHGQGRWSLTRLADTDPRWRPFVLWLLLPIAVWLASPFPNHIKDVGYLVFNVPMGPSSAQRGLSTYLTAIHAEYFAHPAVLVVALGAFLVAAARYRTQPPLVRLLTLMVALQFVMVTAHHTRDARFLLLAMPPFWVVSAHELGRWLSPPTAVVATVSAVATLCASIAGAAGVTATTPFTRLANEHYVASEALASALAAIRNAIPATGDVIVIGRRDTVSPSLIKWQLGPPSGTRTFPIEITREAELPRLDGASLVVVIEPSETPTTHATQRLTRLVAAGELRSLATFHIADLGVSIDVLSRPDRD